MSGNSDSTNTSSENVTRRTKVEVIAEVKSVNIPDNIEFGEVPKVELDNITTQDYIDERFLLIQSGLDRELEESEKHFLKRMISEEEFEDERLTRTIIRLQDKLNILKEFGLSESDVFHQIELEKLRVEQDLSEQRITTARRESEIKQALQEAHLDTAKDAFSTGIELLSQDEKARKKHSSAIKAFESGRVLVNSFSEISEIYKKYASIPGGGIIAAIQAGFSTARAFLAIKKINSQKFNYGGKTGPGFYQDETGHRVAGVVHDNEYVMPKWMVLNPVMQPIINSIEKVRQRGSFADGGFTTPAIAAVQSPAGVGNINVSSSTDPQLIKALLSAADSMNRLPDQIKAFKAIVSYGQLEDVGNTINDLENLSRY